MRRRAAISSRDYSRTKKGRKRKPQHQSAALVLPVSLWREKNFLSFYRNLKAQCVILGTVTCSVQFAHTRWCSYHTSPPEQPSVRSPGRGHDK